MIEYGVRRAGDGTFYLVTLDEYGDAHEFYSGGKLVRFEDAQDAKDYIRGFSEEGVNVPLKKRRLF